VSDRQPTPPAKKERLLIVEPAPLKQRIFAFAMDVSLLMVCAFFLLDTLLLPSEFPYELQEMRQLIQGLSLHEQMEIKDSLSPEVLKMTYFSLNVFTLVFWAYFFFSELFMQGTSLGKKAFSLEILNTRTGTRPSVFEMSLRAITKALAFAFYFPLLFGINYLPALFNKSRRTGHDFICRTIVVQSAKQTLNHNVINKH